MRYFGKCFYGPYLNAYRKNAHALRVQIKEFAQTPRNQHPEEVTQLGAGLLLVSLE